MLGKDSSNYEGMTEPCGVIPDGYDLVYDAVTDTPYHM